VSELTKRILFAVPAAALFLYVTWLGNYYFIGLIILITLFVQREFSMLSGNAGFTPDMYFPYTIGLWILLTPYIPHPLIIGLAIFLIFVALQVFKTGDRALKELVSTSFCGIYAPIGFVTLLLIRNTGTHEIGFLLTISLLLMVWGNDVFAYFGGKAFGKHALAPTVSPNKTWEGFFAGILGAFVGLVLVIYIVPYDFPVSLVTIAPSVLLVSIFGPIGDLTASRIKRAAQAKDAANILPGHGGFFDRFDALILAAPAFYLYLYILKISGYASF
jgi:phosphatidate cytidylyltransferase